MEKLPGIRADLVRLDDNWQDRDLCQFEDSLRRWAERKPKTAGKPEKNFRRDKMFQVREKKDQNLHMSVSIVKNLAINLVNVS